MLTTKPVASHKLHQQPSEEPDVAAPKIINKSYRCSELRRSESCHSSSSYVKQTVKVAKQSVIKEVWIQNFFEELAKLASLIDQEYNVISFVRV